jgi:hypothetical protein
VLGHPDRETRRQEFVASIVLPDRLGRSLGARYPGAGSVGLAKHGLRQWLRLHAVAVDRLILPSIAVEILWVEFMKSEGFQNFQKRAYRSRRLRHERSSKLLALQQSRRDADAAALTFAMACFDEGLDALHPAKLPVLFAVDDELGIAGGQHWKLNCGRSRCSVEDGQRCVKHELVPRIPERLPKQRRFGVPRPYPLGDWPSEAPVQGDGAG